MVRFVPVFLYSNACNYELANRLELYKKKVGSSPLLASALAGLGADSGSKYLPDDDVLPSQEEGATIDRVHMRHMLDAFEEIQVPMIPQMVKPKIFS